MSGSVGRAAALVALTAMAMLLAPAAARADIFVVENTDDSGPGSLRQAITDANAATGGPEDLVDATGVEGEIGLQTALPNLTGVYEIHGPGASKLAVRRSTGEFRIFTVAVGADIALTDLTISGGLTAGLDRGGGILNSGKLAIRRSAVTGNSGFVGGGISNDDDGELTVANSTISGNTARQDSAGGESGGGLINRDGTVTIRNSTVSGNTAGNGRGGGIINSALGGDDNSVTTVVNSTVAANTGSGANLFNQSNSPGAALFSMRSTLIGDPLGGDVNCGSAGAAGFDSEGYNLADDDSCQLTAIADQPNKDPELASLADNGGPTETMAVPFSSPAIDQGISDGLTDDQRGLARPVDFSSIVNAPGGDGADIGAFELQASSKFSFGKVKRNKKKGTARLTVKVPGPGKLKLAKTGKVKGKRKQADGPGKVKLPIKPRGKAKKALEETGKAKVKAKVTYRPDGGGQPKTKKKRIKLKLK